METLTRQPNKDFRTIFCVIEHVYVDPSKLRLSPLAWKKNARTNTKDEVLSKIRTLFLKRRPKNEVLRPKTPWTETKTLGLKRRPHGLKRRPLWIKLLRRFRSVVEFPLGYLIIVIMKSITHLFFDRPRALTF